MGKKREKKRVKKRGKKKNHDPENHNSSEVWPRREPVKKTNFEPKRGFCSVIRSIQNDGSPPTLFSSTY